MTAQCALAMALLEGRVLNVMNCFKDVGYTNIAREIPRRIEEPFGLEVSRTPRVGKNRYGHPTNYVDYFLRKSAHNLDGIKRLKEFIRENLPKAGEAKTTSEFKSLKQQELFLKT